MKLEQLPLNMTQSPHQQKPEQSTDNSDFWGKDGFTFGDVLDIINPLHHLPVVSKYYREHSQDEACEGSKFIGGVLFGGLIGGVAGVISSMTNSAIRHETTQDVSEHLIAMIDQESMATDPFHAGNKHDNPIIPQQQSVSLSQESNPFFAQLFESPVDEQYDFSADKTTVGVRIRDWGKV